VALSRFACTPTAERREISTRGEQTMHIDQSTNRRSLWLPAICLTAGIAVVASHAAVAATVLVDPANMGSWGFYEDGPAGSSGAGSFVSGPGTPPLGSGSAQLSTGDTTSSEVLFNYGTDVGTPLTDITSLYYQSYVVSSPGSNDQSPSLQFNVVKSNSATTYQGRLVFEPYYASTITPGSWQAWNALSNGADWWFSNTTVFNAGCSISAPCTWSQVLADYPTVEINNNYGGFGFKVGSGWTSFVGDVDDFTMGVNSVSTTYNFDPTPTPEPATLALLGSGLLGFAAMRRRRGA